MTTRILLGCQYGAGVLIVYLYAVEISPLKYKTVSGSLVSITTYLGTIFTLFVGLDYVIDGRKFWPYLTCVGSVFPILQVILVYFIPESPTYLFSLQKYEAGRQVIDYLFAGKLHQSDFDLTEESGDSRIRRLSQIDSGIVKSNRPSIAGNHNDRPRRMSLAPAIRSSVQQQKFEKKFKSSILYQIYSDSNLYKPIIYVCILSLTNNLTGVDSMSVIMTTLFKNNFNVSREMAQVLVLALTVFRFMNVTIGSALSHKIDRRVCLLVSYAGIAACLLIVFLASRFKNEDNQLAVSITQIIFMFISYFFYNAGIGLIFWTAAVEIMEPSYKHVGQQISMTCHFLVMGILVYLLTLMQEKLGDYIFLIFIVTNIMSWIYVYFRGVETRNRPAHEIIQVFSARTSVV